MESLTKSEYAAMLPFLQPSQAVGVYNERLKRVTKLNNELADWLQERRRVEEQYVSGLRKLSAFRVPSSQSELGVFRAAWDKVLESVEQTAAAHHHLAGSIDMELETPLRSFSTSDDVRNLTNIHSNLASMARELEDAQEKMEKLSKKTLKSNSKMEQASIKLEAAITNWESQAPFIFESLQVVDESRTNQVRDLLTQYETMDMDCSQRSATSASGALSLLVEISTEREIDQFVHRTTSGRVKPQRSAQTNNAPGATTNGHHPGAAASVTSEAPVGGRAQTPVQAERPNPDYAPQTPASTAASVPTAASTPAQTPTPSRAPAPLPPSSSHGRAPPTSSSTNASFPVPAAFAAPPIPPIPSSDNNLEGFGMNDGKHESSLRSRLGNMLGKRRQSIHNSFPGFGQIGAQKHGRSLGSSHDSGRASPRGSVNDLPATSGQGKLPSLSEVSSDNQQTHTDRFVPEQGDNDRLSPAKNMITESPKQANGFDFGQAPAHQHQSTEQPAGQAAMVDAEGYTIRPDTVDPITLAQQEAAAQANETEQLFKLNIQNKPIGEEDPEEKKAAMTNVASALSMKLPNKRTPTVRGRRDVRNTIYMPAATQQHDSMGEALGLPAFPVSPAIPEKFAQQQQALAQKPPSLAALASESNMTNGSDTLSVRSGTSLSGVNQLRHPELSGEGLSSSIIEIVAATFTPSGLKTMKMNGEVAFAYHGDDANDNDRRETILINNFTNLEAIGPNRIFVHPAVQGRNDQFILNLAHLNRTTTAFTYRIHSDDPSGKSLAQNLPLSIEPSWTTRGDALNLRIILSLYDSCRWDELVLKNVAISVNYKGHAAGVKSKPAGTHLKERHVVYWRMQDLHLKKGEPHKIICQISGADGAPTPGHIDARWEHTPQNVVESLAGISVSRLEETKGKAVAEDEEDDPFADDNEPMSPGLPADAKWTPVPLVYKVASGKYESVTEEESAGVTPPLAMSPVPGSP